MDKIPPDISILLFTCNGELYLDEVLKAIFAQKTRSHFEVIVIDSGSSDRTLEIITKYPASLHKISNREFGHGKTRNLGASLASGQYVVFLTQDATPAHESWLENLIRPLAEDRRVAGAYSRQLPRHDCNPCEWRDIELGAGPIGHVKIVNSEDPFQKKAYETYYRQFMLFSNVCSCIRKEVLEQMPFNEKITMAEDQEWCKRAIEAGYAIVYEAMSAVYHSHNHPLKMIYQRHFDYGASYREFTLLNLPLTKVLFNTFFESICDLAFIIRQPRNFLWKLKWITKSPLVRFAMHYGLHKGLHL